MALLKRAGLIKSIRGAGGGYVLAKDVSEISVGDVLRALEGNLEPVECAAFTKKNHARQQEAVSQSMFGRRSMKALIEQSMRLI